MERKIIDIEISPEALDEAVTENGGVMWEHNAVKLVFHLDPRFAGDYRYYIEYRSISGARVRTQNLELNASDNTVSFDIPVGMSSLMCVECFFNIVRVDGDGNTQQVIKPKKFCLDFELSPDTDNAIAKENDFSVNSLLEAIKNGAFKGEKGDKGDSYALTDGDRESIALRVSGELYGLPFLRRITSAGTVSLDGIAENGRVKSFKITAAEAEFSEITEQSPISLAPTKRVKIFIGKNEAEELLKPEKYSSFTPNGEIYQENYYVVPLYLKPNTKYAAVRCGNELNNCYSAIKTGETTRFFVHSQSGIAKDYIEFTAPDDGIVYWVSTVIGSGYERYAELLKNSLYGFGIYELDKSVIISIEPETPLYSIANDNCDEIDVIKGEIRHNIASFTLHSDDLPIKDLTSFSAGDKTVYRYLIDVGGNPEASFLFAPLSTHYKPLKRFIDSDEALAVAVSCREDCTGVFISEYGEVYFYSEKDPDEWYDFIIEQEAAGTPIELLYRMKYHSAEKIQPNEIVLNGEYEFLRVFPEELKCDMQVNGDISDALNKLLAAKG